MNSLEELDREDLLFFIGCYNNYIIDFYDTHENGMQPVCAYEYFDTDFQEILEDMETIEEITEYCLIFKDNTEMAEIYGGEFFSEDKSETEEIFEEYKEQIEQYYAKTWEKRGECCNWYETDVEVIYDYRKEK